MLNPLEDLERSVEVSIEDELQENYRLFIVKASIKDAMAIENF